MRDLHDEAPDRMATVNTIGRTGESIEVYEFPRRDYVGISITAFDPSKSHFHRASGLVDDYSIDLLIDYLQQVRHRMPMTPYVQRAIFRDFELGVYARAVKAVEHIGAHWGSELRCHELARAVHRFLDIQVVHHYRGADGKQTALQACVVHDGRMGPIEHSWIELAIPLEDDDRRLGDYHEMCLFRRAIIDVYAPGRLPQVQMIHRSRAVTDVSSYVVETARTDIRQEIVDRAYAEMVAGSKGTTR